MRRTTLAAVAATGALALLAAACGDDAERTAPVSSPDDPTATVAAPEPTEPTDTVDLAQDETPTCPTEGEEIETTKLYIEYNATDDDTGVHGLFGGEAWRHLCIWDPDGTMILTVDPLEQFDDLAVSDFFFESREPESSDVAIEEILAAFPEGEYLVGAVDYEGVDRAGSATFSHDIPIEPVITAPTLVEEPEQTGDATVATSGLVVGWEPVTETLTGDTPVVTAYEVIVTNEEVEDPVGRSTPIFDVIVGPEHTSVSVPEDFLEPGTVYELEVLVLEESGNQTIGLGFFATE